MPSALLCLFVLLRLKAKRVNDMSHETARRGAAHKARRTPWETIVSCTERSCVWGEGHRPTLPPNRLVLCRVFPLFRPEESWVRPSVRPAVWHGITWSPPPLWKLACPPTLWQASLEPVQLPPSTLTGRLGLAAGNCQLQGVPRPSRVRGLRGVPRRVLDPEHGPPPEEQPAEARAWRVPSSALPSLSGLVLILDLERIADFSFSLPARRGSCPRSGDFRRRSRSATPRAAEKPPCSCGGGDAQPLEAPEPL